MFLERNHLALLAEVKIRGPNQGMGPIPALKKWGSGTDPRAQKNHVVEPILQITSVVIPEQHFLNSWIGSQNQKLLSMGSDSHSTDVTSFILLGALPELHFFGVGIKLGLINFTWTFPIYLWGTPYTVSDAKIHRYWYAKMAPKNHNETFSCSFQCPTKLSYSELCHQTIPVPQLR